MSRDANPVRRVAVALLAVLVLTVAVLMIVRDRRSSSKFVPVPAFAETGRVLARETTRLLNGAGKVVVWQLELQSDANPVLRASAQAFTRTLRETRGVTVTATVQESYNPWNPESWKQTAVEPSRFIALVEQYRQADALVLIGELPRLTEEDCRRLPTPRPKITAVALLGQPSRCLWEQQVVQVGIVPRSDTSPDPTLPKSPAEWFQRMFTVVTAENAGSLP